MGKSRKGGIQMSVAALDDYLGRNPAAARGDALAAVQGTLSSGPTSASHALATLMGQPSGTTPKPAAEALARAAAGGRRDSSARTGIEGQETDSVIKGPTEYARISASVRHAMVQTRVERREDGHPQELVIWFAGAQLMSQNQLISALQRNFKSYLGYKKAWKTKMKLVRRLIHAEGPCQFVDPVRIEVLRQASRLADYDGLTPQFKILIDELRYQTKDRHQQPDPTQPPILIEDNPHHVVAVVPYQRQVLAQDAGVRGVGLRLVACPGWVTEPAPDPIRDWLKQAAIEDV